MRHLLSSSCQGHTNKNKVGQRQMNTVWYHYYVASQKMIQMKTYKTETGLQTQRIDLWLPRGLKGSGRGGLGVWDYACMLCLFSPVRLFAILWATARQAPLPMGFSRQEDWSGLPCPPPGALPNPGIEPTSLMSSALAGGFFTPRATWEALLGLTHANYYMKTG